MRIISRNEANLHSSGTHAMAHMFCHVKLKEAAFTVVEITIAILILASALVTLLGLQSSIIERTIRDRNRIQAMLVARHILSAIESAKVPLSVNVLDGTPSEIVSELLGIEGQQDDAIFYQPNFSARVQIEDWEIAVQTPLPLLKVTVIVFWSERPIDSVQVTYFAPKEDS